MKFEPHAYQEQAIDFLLDRLFINSSEGAGLFLDPGLGKTAITLETLTHMRGLGEAGRTLIVAPLRPVYSVWPAEINKWDFKFTYQIVHGTPNQRRKALFTDADIHLVNPEGLKWLSKQDHSPWDTLVIDESTKFKNWMSQRTRVLRGMVPDFRNRIILTGTPAPNSLSDLFAQVYMLDTGETLGQTVTFFRSKFMKRGGYQGYKWSVRDEAAAQDITEAIAPLVLTMTAEDHLDMPKLLNNEIWVSMDAITTRAYKKLERELFLKLANGDDLIASGAGGAYAHCKGFANGGVYEQKDEGRVAHQIHNAKLDAFVDLVEELQGKPVLVAYEFYHDLERLKTKFPSAPCINGKTSPKDSESILAEWSLGKHNVLLCQPQSVSHGLNMQGTCNDVAFFSLTDQPDVYEQFIRRVYRQGAVGQVRVHHILTSGTVDEVRMSRLQEKRGTERSLIDALKEYRKVAV